MVTQYAILDASGVCINRVLWDGVSDWQPPEGTTAVPDEEGNHPLIPPKRKQAEEQEPNPGADSQLAEQTTNAAAEGDAAQ